MELSFSFMILVSIILGCFHLCTSFLYNSFSICLFNHAKTLNIIWYCNSKKHDQEALRFFFQMLCFILKVFWSDKTQVWEVKQIDWVVFIIIKRFYTLNFLYYETFDWATSYKLTNRWSALISSYECLVYVLSGNSSRPQTLQLTYRIFVDRE